MQCLEQEWGACGLGPHAARLSFKCGPRVHTAHVMLGLPYVLLFNISAY